MSGASIQDQLTRYQFKIQNDCGLHSDKLFFWLMLLYL